MAACEQRIPLVSERGLGVAATGWLKWQNEGSTTGNFVLVVDVSNTSNTPICLGAIGPRTGDRPTSDINYY